MTPLFLFRDAATGITVREARGRDAQTLSAIGARAFHHTHASMLHPADLAGVASRFDEAGLRENIEKRHSRVLVALWSGEVVGYSQLCVVPAESVRSGELRPMELHGVFVAPDWSGNGVGSSLLAASNDLARRLGHGSLWVRFFAENRHGVEFLKRLGFICIGEENVLGRNGWTPVVTLSRTL